MEQLIAIGLDAIAVIIVLGCMNAAAKKGFLRTVIQMVAYLVILLASCILSRAAAPVVFDKVVQPILLEKIEAPLETAPSNADLICVTYPGTLSMVDARFDSLLPKVKNSHFFDNLTSNAVRPIMISAISMIGFFIIFALLSVLVHILLTALGVIDHIPVVGTVNAVLGGAVGVFQGLLLVLVLCILLKGLLHLHPGGWPLLNDDVLERTFICRYFLNLNIIGRLFA